MNNGALKSSDLANKSLLRKTAIKIYWLMSLSTINERNKNRRKLFMCKKKKKKTPFNNIPESRGNIYWKCLKDCEFF